MRVLIGAAGMIGRKLARALAADRVACSHPAPDVVARHARVVASEVEAGSGRGRPTNSTSRASRWTRSTSTGSGGPQRGRRLECDAEKSLCRMHGRRLQV